ncbi:MAG: FkbM family methyltransferase [Planctomycetota bacterium]
MNNFVRTIVNGVAGTLGVRLVNRNWGPRGPFETLKRARAAGVVVKQAVDVGASTGVWTRDALAIYPDARFFMVDALEHNRPALEKVKRDQPACDYWIGALGATPGRLSFNSTGDQSSFFVSETFPAKQVVEVDVRTLDSFLDTKTIALPELIKADIQGFELELLKGSTRCLQHAELVLLEVSLYQIYANAPLAHDVIAWMGNNGFRIYDMCTYALRSRDNELANMDILFAPNSSKLFAYEGW